MGEGDLPRAFITGGTGFLGSHFLLNFVGRNIDQAFVLVRGSDIVSCENKLAQSLNVAGATYVPQLHSDDVWNRLTIIKGDLASPLFGLREDVIAHISDAAVEEFWHFAATLSFEDYRADEIHALNVEGTKEAIKMAEMLGVSKFIYVSTAYSCGAQAGEIAETLHSTDRPFLNEYEKSKCFAEHAITDECQRRGIALTILRPSVVVGNSRTKLAGGSTTGLYGMLREMSRLRPVLLRAESSARIFGNPEGEVNFIPVDRLMDDLRSIVQKDSLIAGGIFHLTYDANPSLAEAAEVIFSELNLKNLHLALPSNNDFSPIEQLIDRRTAFYRGYLNSNKIFTKAGRKRRRMTVDDFRGFVAEGIKLLDGSRKSDNAKMLRIEASDGAMLNTYVMGSATAPAVLLCNAVGMPMECMRPLMENLACGAKVVTWECRGLPSPANDIASLDVSLDRHVADALDVCTAHGLDRVVLIGWCSGARLAMRKAAAFPDLVSGLVLLNGGHIGGTVPTLFEQNIKKVMPLIAANRRYARLFYESIFRRKTLGDAESEQGKASELASSTLLATDSPQFLHLANQPFRSEESLFAYARILSAYLIEPVTEAELHVRVPTLISTGTADTTVNPQSSRELANRMAGAQFREAEGCDHFALYHDKELMADISAFIRAAHPVAQLQTGPSIVQSVDAALF
jgi:nucleoside-diphosphate-sugar epimerase/predicted esterase